MRPAAASTILLAVLGTTLAPPLGVAAAAAALEWRDDAEVGADAYLAAFRSGDEAPRDAAVARFRPDPFRVAAALFARHIEQIRAAPDAPGDFLAAAGDLAHRASARPATAGLVRLVERWNGLGKEDLEREWKLIQQSRAAFQAGEKADAPGSVLAIVMEARSVLDDGPPCMAAVELSNHEAWALFSLGRTREAIGASRRATRLADSLEWPQAKLGPEGALTGEAVGLQFLGELRAARTVNDQHMNLAREIGWTQAEHVALANQARVLAMIGEFHLALDAYDRAERHFDGERLPAPAAQCAIARLQVLSSLGRFEESILGLQALLGREVVAKIPFLRAATLQSLGHSQMSAGRTALALSCYEEAAELFGRLGARAVRIQCVRSQGVAWRAAGDPEQAMRCFEAAAAELEQTPNAQEAAWLNSALSRALIDLGRSAEASRRLSRVLEFASRSGERPAVLTATLDLADCSLLEGRAEEAAERCSGVLNEHAVDGTPAILDRARLILGDALERLGRHREAEAAWESVATSARTRGELHVGSLALSALARSALAKGDFSAALSRAAEASEMTLLRATGLGDEIGRSLRLKAAETTDVGLAACHALLRAGGDSTAGVPAEALRLVERGRTLTLLEDLAMRDVLVAVAIGTDLDGRRQAARARAESARREIASLQARDAPDDELAEARGNLDAASDALEDAESQVRRRAHLEAGRTRLGSADATAIQAALPAGTLLLDYRIGVGQGALPARSTLVAVARDWIEVVDLGPSDSLVSAAEGFLTLASTPDADDTASGAALFDRVLRPIARRLASARRLLVSADPPLLSVPFEAIVERTPDGPRRLIERLEVVMVPSGTVFASLLHEDRARFRGEWLLALGDPEYPPPPGVPEAPNRLPVLRGEALGLRRLSGSAAEVRELGAHFSEKDRLVLTGAQASSDELAAALSSRSDRLSVLHIACHGILDERRPLLSGLALAGGRILTVNEVYRMSIPADLAVLSACHTGSGRLAEDDSVASLVRAFLCAGSSRVVVTRWGVEDSTSAAFMSAFYRAHLKERRGPAEALRAAQLSCLRSGGADAHPARWAAFALWGLPE